MGALLIDLCHRRQRVAQHNAPEYCYPKRLHPHHPPVNGQQDPTAENGAGSPFLG